MTGFAYLASLLLSTGAMVLVDARWRLAFWRAPIASALAVGTGTVLLLGWDLVGVGFGVFFRGESPWATGAVVAPGLPLEEPVFLSYLCYLSLVAVLGAEHLLERREGGGAARDPDADPTTDVTAATGRHP
jgi:lycopene cyclase domain-containing protein